MQGTELWYNTRGGDKLRRTDRFFRKRSRNGGCGERGPGADVAGAGQVPVQMWQGRAHSRWRKQRSAPCRSRCTGVSTSLSRRTTRRCAQTLAARSRGSPSAVEMCQCVSLRRRKAATTADQATGTGRHRKLRPASGQRVSSGALSTHMDYAAASTGAATRPTDREAFWSFAAPRRAQMVARPPVAWDIETGVLACTGCSWSWAATWR